MAYIQIPQMIPLEQLRQLRAAEERGENITKPKFDSVRREEVVHQTEAASPKPMPIKREEVVHQTEAASPKPMPIKREEVIHQTIIPFPVSTPIRREVEPPKVSQMPDPSIVEEVEPVKKESITTPYKIIGVAGTYAGEEFGLAEEMIIGVNPDEADIVYPPTALGIGRMHCSLSIDKTGAVLIKDLGSAEGTYLEHGIRLKEGIFYRMEKGECFYLATKQEMYRIM